MYKKGDKVKIQRKGNYIHSIMPQDMSDPDTFTTTYTVLDTTSIGGSQVVQIRLKKRSWWFDMRDITRVLNKNLIGGKIL